MKIIWNKVTWYSKTFAIIIGIATIWLGIYFTQQYQEISKAPIATNNPAMIKASVDQALYPVPMGGGPAHASVSYFNIVGDTAYVLLNIDLDGWAGVSFAIAKAHPVVEQTLLTFPEIKKVVFGYAWGDSKGSTTSSPDTLGWKTYRNEKYGFEFYYPADWVLNYSNEDGYIGVSVTNPMFISKPGSNEPFGGFTFVIRTPEYYTEMKANGEFLGKKALIENWRIDTSVNTLMKNIDVLEDLQFSIVMSVVQGNKESINIEDKILSTFKFTK